MKKEGPSFEGVWKQQLSPSEKLVAMFALGQTMDIGFEMLGLWSMLWSFIHFSLGQEASSSSSFIKKDMFLLSEEENRLVLLPALRDLKREIDRGTLR